MSPSSMRRDREPLQVLRDVSLELSAGQNLAIVGPSGSGKSTLLYAIGTLDPPTQGTVTLGGQNPYVLAEAALARFRNQHIGFIFQDHHLLPQLSVLENVLIPTLAEGAPTAAQQQRARELLQRVGLQDRLDHRPAELSGGERGRVAVARALITRTAARAGRRADGQLGSHQRDGSRPVAAAAPAGRTDHVDRGHAQHRAGRPAPTAHATG